MFPFHKTPFRVLELLAQKKVPAACRLQEGGAVGGGSIKTVSQNGIIIAKAGKKVKGFFPENFIFNELPLNENRALRYVPLCKDKIGVFRPLFRA